MTTPDPTRAAMQMALEALEATTHVIDKGWAQGIATVADRSAVNSAIAALRASLSSLAAGEEPPAPPGWWTEELERIFSATPGQRITDQMKRAAAIALRVARGERWDDEKQDWSSAPRGAAGEEVARTPQVPCPVCGGEAVHAQDILARTIIAPAVAATECPLCLNDASTGQHGVGQCFVPPSAPLGAAGEGGENNG